jgi:UDP-N-acetylmuramyl tripeptide synthase
MTRDDIIRMAREAGLGNVLGVIEGGALHRFFYMAQAAEREACAKVCEDKNTLLAWPTYAHAIRARGQA